ncbi:hypothetical protein chiPu_0019126 [Chiloscyllium punctatum]|uniref:Uncharacterized protein n=1 Tax=Chiloscyllium punctatum TaxID=137246 RepID=A0A401RQX5_CHIPU|nr:hypothetical protein [Chiloscyllium punctatum]
MILDALHLGWSVTISQHILGVLSPLLIMRKAFCGDLAVSAVQQEWAVRGMAASSRQRDQRQRPWLLSAIGGGGSMASRFLLDST